MRVVTIVGDYGPHAGLFPIAGSHGGVLILFCDYRNTLEARREAYKAMVGDRTDIELELFYAAAIPVECDKGVHMWEPVTRNRETVSSWCVACGTEIALPEPLPPIRVVGRLRAVG